MLPTETDLNSSNDAIGASTFGPDDSDSWKEFPAGGTDPDEPSPPKSGGRPSDSADTDLLLRLRFSASMFAYLGTCATRADCLRLDQVAGAPWLP